MALHKIRLGADPVLRTVCAPVTAFDAALSNLASEMLETMYAAPGRGLAAPQIGVTQRVFVMDTTWKDGNPSPQVFVNPEILGSSDETATLEEGCLSIPGQLVTVTRPAVVELRWTGVDGASHTGTFDGFSAACVQHEIDHLDGILCTDYAKDADVG